MQHKFQDGAMGGSKAAAEKSEQAANMAIDKCRLVKGVWRRCTGFFAKNPFLCFFVTLVHFCFACGLLSYTESNKMHVRTNDLTSILNSTGLLNSTHTLDDTSTSMMGFGPVNTTWRQAICSIVIASFFFTSISIFWKQQNMLFICGTCITWSAVALFVVASFDKQTADLFCVQSPLECDPKTATVSSAGAVMGNLYIAPWLDYICCIIFYIGGGTLLHSAEITQAEVDRKYADVNANKSGANKSYGGEEI